MTETNTNTLRIYCQQIRGYELLSKEEEQELARKIKTGTPGEAALARERLINSNLKLVISIAKCYHNAHLQMIDLIQEGNLGLMEAVDRFDPEQGTRFSTCATPWIKSAIIKTITDNNRLIRIPAHLFQLQSKFRQAKTAIESDGHVATNEELAKALGVSVDKIDFVKSTFDDVLSMDKQLDGSDSNSDVVGDLVADETVADPTEQLAKEELKEALYKAIDGLDSRTKLILTMRWGLDGTKEHTLDEIGAAVDLTRERVRQILKATESQLRVKLANWEQVAVL